MWTVTIVALLAPCGHVDERPVTPPVDPEDKEGEVVIIKERHSSGPTAAAPTTTASTTATSTVPPSSQLPVTAPPPPATTTTTTTNPPLSNANSHKAGLHPRPSERKITIANTDLLFKLFEGVEKKERNNPIPHLKRGSR